MKWSVSAVETRNPGGVDFDNLAPEEKQNFDPLVLDKDQYNGKVLSEHLRDELEKDGYEVWFAHPLDKDFKTRAKRDYEIFMGGFLYFYDKELLRYLKELSGKSDQTGVTVETVNKLREYFKKQKRLVNPNAPDAPNGLEMNHSIFFEWGKGAKAKGKKGEQLEDRDYVRVYINPPAGNPDPPIGPKPPPPEQNI